MVHAAGDAADATCGLHVGRRPDLAAGETGVLGVRAPLRPRLRQPVHAAAGDQRHDGQTPGQIRNPHPHGEQDAPEGVNNLSMLLKS